MTKEITKAFIIQEIEDKFKLRELEPERFRFSEEVVPTYNIEQHLQKWESYWMNANVTGIGPLSIKVIPDFERWRLRGYSATFVSGAYTIAGIYILRKTRRDTTDFSYLDLTAAQSVSYLKTLPEAVVLEPGDMLYANIDGFTSAGVLRLDMDYMKEILR